MIITDKMRIRYVKLEVERQLDIAKRQSLPRKDWKDINKNWVSLLGAYHLGRQEGLEDILSKIREGE
jgi:hypothetical protein